MIATTVPFNRTRVRATVDTSLLRTKVFGRTRGKLQSYYQIPALDLSYTWRGASEIIYRFDYDISNEAMTNSFPLTPPTTLPGFVPVIAWRVGEEFVRYKLWETVREILWLPLYNKEKITADTFHIEIWNTKPLELGLGLEEDGEGLGQEEGFLFGLETNFEGTALLESPIKLYSTRRVVPTTLCAESEIELDAPTTCVDPVYNLDNFEPAFGDYYLLVAPCERELVKGRIGKPDYNLLQNKDDLTWHYVWAKNDGGNIYLDVDPENVEPPVDALGYFPIKVGDKVYKFQLAQSFQSEGNYFHVGDEIENPDWLNVALIQTFLEQSDSLLYGITLSSNKQFNVIQTSFSL